MSLYEGIKTAIIYGAGKGGALTYEHLTKNGIEVVAFIDDFKTGEYLGKPIIKLDDIKNYNVDGYFVGTAKSMGLILRWAKNILDMYKDANVYISSIIPLCDSHGNKLTDYPEVIPVPPLNPKQYLSLFEENDFIKDFDWYLDFIVYNLNFIGYDRFHRLDKFYDMEKLNKYYNPECKKYYSYPDIDFDVEEGDIVFDCGANSSEGLNCDYFAIKAGEKGKVYAFEPIPRIYTELLEDIKDFKNIVPVNMGVSDKKGVAYFEDMGGGSRVSEKGSVRVELTTIDDFVKENNIEKVDFIKMDIEGAELDALKGATNTIKTFKPKLAICVYHKPEHFYEIPQFIKSLVPEYKIWLLNNELWGWNGTKVFCII
ncbi:FkbM family methyltransferase [Hydrogenobaculum acidophilum]